MIIKKLKSKGECSCFFILELVEYYFVKYGYNVIWFEDVVEDVGYICLGFFYYFLDKLMLY